MLVKTSVLVLEWASQNGSWQHLCPHDKSQLQLASLEVLQDHQMGLTRAPFKFLLLPWVSELVRFCVYHLGVDLWTNILLHLLPSKPYWPSKPNILEAYLPKVGYPGWGAHCEARNPCFLGRTSELWLFSCQWIAYLEYRSWLYHIFTSCYGSFFIPLVLKDFFLLAFRSISLIIAL